MAFLIARRGLPSCGVLYAPACSRPNRHATKFSLRKNFPYKKFNALRRKNHAGESASPQHADHAAELGTSTAGKLKIPSYGQRDLRAGLERERGTLSPYVGNVRDDGNIVSIGTLGTAPTAVYGASVLQPHTLGVSAGVRSECGAARSTGRAGADRARVRFFGFSPPRPHRHIRNAPSAVHSASFKPGRTRA